MMKKWKKLMAAVCIASMLVTMPGMCVLATENQEEAIVTEAEVPEETVDSFDFPTDKVENDADAQIIEENIDQEEAEEVIGEGPIQVGDGVTATFDADTGAVEFLSQNGELRSDWVDNLGVDRNKIKSIRAASGTVNLPVDSSGHYPRYRMFSGLTNLTNLDLSGFDTSNVTDMYQMFYGCRSLTSLDLSSFDTTNVTNMGAMFDGCSSLTNLDLGNFDTSNVTDMYQMFYGCRSLTSLDLSSFDTTNVTNMGAMFDGCSSLTNLDLGNFDTTNVTDMCRMFSDCRKLTSLNLSGFDTSSVMEMGNMFSDCWNLGRLDLSSFTTLSVNNMQSMFYQCSSLTNLDLSNVDTSMVSDMSNMFKGCSNLTTLDVSHFNTANVTDMPGMFGNCASLTNLDVSNFDTANVTDMSNMFEGCNSLTTLDVSHFNTANVTYMSGMFEDCASLTNLDVSNFDTANVTYYMSNMFNGCDKLTTLDVSHFNTAKITDMSGMFGNCASLTNLDVSNFDTSKVTNMSNMFDGCDSLTTLDVSHFDTAKVTNMSGMFGNCASLTNLDVSNFDTSNVSLMTLMFDGCSSLTSLDVSNFDTSNVDDMVSMFSYCYNLETLNVSRFDTSNVKSMRDMFFSCEHLTSLDVRSFNTSQVTDMCTMFYGCKRLKNLDLSNFDIANVTNIERMFYDCGNINNLNLSGFDTSKITQSQQVFSGCERLESLYAPKTNSRVIELPCTMYDSMGKAYDSLPIAKNNTVLLKNKKIIDGEDDHGGDDYGGDDHGGDDHGGDDHGGDDHGTDGGETDNSSYCSITNGTYYFRSSLKNDDSIEYSFDYDDNWLFSNSQDDRYKLMKASIRVAMAAFGTKTDNDYGAENIKKMMDTMRFTYTDASITYEKPENDSIGSAIGMKKIKKQDGSTASIILVALRGGGYGAEWGGDFRVGLASRSHEGFRRAATTVEERLEEFYKTNKDNINEDLRIWLVGYSRAAATANLVAADLIDGICNMDLVDPEEVRAFCFECPRNTIDSNAFSSKYANIINVVNPIDFVPKVAFKGWGFARYGKTYYTPSKETTANYEEKYKYQMIWKYQDVCNQNGITLTEDKVVEVLGQASILDSYLDFLSTFISRKKYYSSHENTFMNIARSTLGGSGTPDWGAAIPSLLKVLGVSLLKPLSTGEIIGMFKSGNTGPGPSAHYPELCMSWIDSLGSFSRFQTSDNSWYRKVLVNCPVEVIVIDSSGSTVGHIVNDTVEEIEDGIAVRIDEDGQKVFILPQDEEYEVKVIAEEDAIINYAVEEYNFDSNEIEKVINYKKIDALQGEEISGTASIGNSIDDAEYTLKYAEKDEMIEPDEVLTGDEIEMFAVDVSCVGQGSITGGGAYANGEFAQVTAVPDDGYEFIGWFIENELVSREEEYRFAVEKNTLLEARFSSSSNSITPTPTVTPIPTPTPTNTPTPKPSSQIKQFSDVQDPTHPYYKAIYWAAEKGITGGYKDGTFGINKACTRGHAVMFLWRMAGSPAPKDASKLPFPDVPKNHPYYKAVLWAQQKGITKGYSSGVNKGKFGIDDTCTRGQIMSFIWRFKVQPAPNPVSKSPFRDVPMTHAYYKAILWGSQNGVTKGYTSGPNAGNFGINDSCTRGQIVKFLYNIR